MALMRGLTVAVTRLSVKFTSQKFEGGASGRGRLDMTAQTLKRNMGGVSTTAGDNTQYAPTLANAAMVLHVEDQFLGCISLHAWNPLPPVYHLVENVREGTAVTEVAGIRGMRKLEFNTDVRD